MNQLESIKDAINVLQLLVSDLIVNKDNPYIIRSINTVIKILKSAIPEESEIAE